MCAFHSYISSFIILESMRTWKLYTVGIGIHIMVEYKMFVTGYVADDNNKDIEFLSRIISLDSIHLYKIGFYNGRDCMKGYNL